MTHLHLSTLGQCLISLARQGIKEPLHRVLRFVESGATVPNFQKSISKTNQKSDSKICFQKEMAPPTVIKTDQVKVSFKKSSAILDQINQIQQLPDSGALDEQQSLNKSVLPTDYSTEQQCEEIQQIIVQNSPISYRNLPQ